MKIETGYKPGLIGRITEMHARYYAKTSGFGLEFESVVANGLAEFAPRLERPINEVWTITFDGDIAASIAIDGEDLGNNTAHLRWFIVDDVLRGSGAGTQLLETALQFCELHKFSKVDLWTFSGLAAARHLYEKHGFELSDEYAGNQWGTTVTEQKFAKLLG